MSQGPEQPGAARSAPSGMGGHRAHNRRVVVVGAGVAGLTAAHELAERGFEVEVVERFGHGDNPEIGGMARTQWAAAPVQGTRRVPWMSDAEGRPWVRDWKMLPTVLPLRFTREESLFGWTGDPPDLEDPRNKESKEKLGRLVERFVGHVNAWESKWAEAAKGTVHPPRFALRVVTYCQGPSEAASAKDLAKWMADRLVERIEEEAAPVAPGGGVPAGPTAVAARSRVDIAVTESETGSHLGRKILRTDQPEVRVVFVEVVQDIVPGEHGFRLFPAWYRHVLDTLERIPLRADPDRAPFADAGWRVSDNLRPNDCIQYALDKGDTFRLPRVRIRSLEEGRKVLRNLFFKAGYTSEDVGRLALKNLQYLTSCTARRAKEYENRTSFDLLGGERLSDRARRHLSLAPELLVALDARDGDARSNGNVAAQMLMDQFSAGNRVDCTLNGPTSVAWFRPWRAYLESQGVRFRRAELKGLKVFDVPGLPPVVRPVFGEFDPHHPGTPKGDPGNPLDRGTTGTSGPLLFPADYYVLALSAHELVRVLTLKDEEAAANGVSSRATLEALSKRLDGAESDIVRAQTFPLGLDDCKNAGPKGPLRHMAGIQFFLDSDLKFVTGHHAYPDSPWALTAVSQPQYWAERRRDFDGYRGVLSVIITRWDEPGEHEAKGMTAWECSPEMLARETWSQVRAAFPAGAGLNDIEPLCYHVDRSLHDMRRGRENRNPYMVNLAGQWKGRPGEPGDYRVQLGCLVFAGTLMKTWTRLTSMEASNESARHAVNAILDHVRHPGQRCDTWDPEQHEFEDLKALKRLDEKLVERGAPHVLDSPFTESALGLFPWRAVTEFAGRPEPGDER